MACQFLEAQQDQVAEIYILGDIVNTWLGDDLVPAEFNPFVTTLQKLSESGIRLFLMVGNRDFMLGKDFATEVGATLLGDSYPIQFGDHAALLLHGDTLCLDDISYQRYRKVVRNRFLQWCFLKLPARFRQNISDKIIAKSKQKKQYKTAMIMDVNQSEVSRVIETHQIDILIHGHTHRPAIHELATSNDKPSYRVVLGDWDDHISYLIADDQQLSLHDHRLDSGCQTLRLS
jgi:UDP-2,3-diacylglucosamine hydrolase